MVLEKHEPEPGYWILQELQLSNFTEWHPSLYVSLANSHRQFPPNQSLGCKDTLRKNVSTLGNKAENLEDQLQMLVRVTTESAGGGSQGLLERIKKLRDTRRNYQD